MPDRIVVEGLREVRKGIKAVGDAEGTRELKDAGWRVANDIVVPGAQGRAGGVAHHSTGRSASFSRAAGTLRAARLSTGAGVRFGRGLAWAMGSEWGSRRFTQFNPPNRGGWFLWPTITDEGQRISDEYADAVEAVFERHGR